MRTTAIMLPSELKHCIAMSCTRSSLASLAQVHTSYQREMERVLYHTLFVHTGSRNEVLCLDTLSANPEKALLVHSLTVEFPRAWTDESHRAAVLLPNALGHMHALSDLRIRFPNGKPDPSQEQVNAVLRNKHFQLHTLYCNDSFDLAGIIENHPELQLVGIYTWGGDIALLNILKRLDALHMPLPTVFALERESYLPCFDHLSIFPAFSPNGSTISRAVADSFDQDLARDIHTAKEHVAQVSIYLKDFSDIALLSSIVEDMTICFPGVFWLNFSFQRPGQIQDPQIKDILSFVTGLRELNFYIWEDTPRAWVLPKNIRRAQAEEWSTVCPELWQIQFPDGLTLEKQDSGWTAL